MKALIGLAFLLAGCAVAPKPDVWTRTDGQPTVTPALASASAECRNEAYLAGAKMGRLPAAALEAYAQGAGDYMVGSPPSPSSYGAPIVGPQIGDGLANIPNAYYAGVERRRRLELQEQVIRSTMDSCMAKRGYLKAA